MAQKDLSQIVQPLLKWYDDHARILPWRSSKNPYHIWVSEIMLQQTRVDTVISYYERFISQLPTIASLAEVDEQTLLKLWEGLGYYRRVQNMQKAAKIIMADLSGQFPSSYEKLLKLPGIGTYSGGAIASIAFEEHIAAVDGNVLRVFARITAMEDDITLEKTKRTLKETIMNILPENRIGDFNQALMELGATVCTPSGIPKCELCPLSHLCTAFKNNSMHLFPVKSPKKARRIEYKTIFLLTCNGKIAIRKRNQKGLLSGLWEFPNMEGALELKEVLDLLNKKAIHHDDVRFIGHSKHVFTHIEWHMSGYHIQLKAETPSIDADILWITKSELIGDYPVPTALIYYTNIAKNFLE